MKSKFLLFACIFTVSISSTFTSLAGKWKQDGDDWKYEEDNGINATNGWREINDNWYFFDNEGRMLRDTKTPDGYEVGKSGEWIKPNDIIEPSSSGKVYIFDQKGKWVNDNKIPEGEYVYYPDENADSVMGSSSWVSNFNYVRIYKDDIINTGKYVPVKNVIELDITKPGVFLVGKDIKSGPYNLIPFKYDGTRITSPKCIVFNTIPSSKDESSPQKNINQDFYVGRKKNNTVTVKDGQYIQLIDCSADFVRP